MIAGGLAYVDQRVKPLSEYQELAANLIDENIEHLGVFWSRSTQSPKVITDQDAAAFVGPLTVTTLIDTPVALDLADRMLAAENLGAERAWAIDSFTQPVHGSLGKDENGTLIYNPEPDFIGTEQLNYVLRNNYEHVSAQATVHIVPPKTFASDDFRGPTIDPKWSLVGYAGEAQIQAENGERFLRLIVPDGGDYDAKGTNNTVRLVQPVALKADFAVEAGFLSLPEQPHQMQGILIEQDPETWLHFGIYKDNSGIKIFGAKTENGRSSLELSSGIEAERARYLRVVRSGDEWTLAHSADGASWVTAGTFAQTLNIVTAVGIFAGATKGADGHPVLIDYFINAASPLEFEDGVPNLSIERATMAQDEGNTGTTPFELVVSRENSKDAISDTTMVEYVVTGSGMVPADRSDFVGGAWPKGRLEFSENNETQTITIPVLGDADFERDETFAVTLTNATNGRVIDSKRTATILNDDPRPPSPVKSDDFSSSQLSPFWVFHGPGGLAEVAHSGEDKYLSIKVPEGDDYEAWNTNNAIRVVQRGANEDFLVKAKFLTNPMNRFQMQGIIIEQDPENWLRFDVHFDGSNTKIFGAATANGRSVKKFNKAIAAENAVYLRAIRSGDAWTFDYSDDDGVSWSTAGSYVASLTVTAVGVFAGATSEARGFEAQVDLFEYLSDPIVQYDYQPSNHLPANN